MLLDTVNVSDYLMETPFAIDSHNNLCTMDMDSRRRNERFKILPLVYLEYDHSKSVPRNFFLYRHQFLNFFIDLFFLTNNGTITNIRKGMGLVLGPDRANVDRRI